MTNIIERKYAKTKIQKIIRKLAIEKKFEIFNETNNLTNLLNILNNDGLLYLLNRCIEAFNKIETTWLEEKIDKIITFDENFFGKSVPDNIKVSLHQFSQAATHYDGNANGLRKMALKNFVDKNEGAAPFLRRYNTKKAAERFAELYLQNFTGGKLEDSLPKYWNPKGDRPKFKSTVVATDMLNNKEVYNDSEEVWKYMVTGEVVPPEEVKDICHYGTDEGVKMSTQDLTFRKALKNTAKFAKFCKAEDFGAVLASGTIDGIEVDPRDAKVWAELSKTDENIKKIIGNKELEKSYVILLDKEKYQFFKGQEDDDPNYKRKLQLSLIVQEITVVKRNKEKKEFRIETHPVWDMGHLPEHEYKREHVRYMLGKNYAPTVDERDTKFEARYKDFGNYEVQNETYNRAQIGDEEVIIDEEMDIED